MLEQVHCLCHIVTFISFIGGSFSTNLETSSSHLFPLNDFFKNYPSGIIEFLFGLRMHQNNHYGYMHLSNGIEIGIC